MTARAASSPFDTENTQEIICHDTAEPGPLLCRFAAWNLHIQKNGRAFIVAVIMILLAGIIIGTVLTMIYHEPLLWFVRQLNDRLSTLSLPF